MEKFIIQKDNVFTSEFCDELIDVYNTYNSDNIEKIDNIKKNYYKINLNKNISKNKHIITINSEIHKTLKFFNEKINEIINDELILLDNYNFLKFDKEKGFMSYSNDYIFIENMYSFFEFIIFLNDVQEGGYVEIMGNFKIKPEKGTLLIFPSGWCFPYSHKIPVSNDKYIISGKIFNKFNK
jgi:hypothetical protein